MACREITGIAREDGYVLSGSVYDTDPISIPCNQYSRINFLISCTSEDLSSVIYKVEFSNNERDWYQVSSLQEPAIVAGSDLTAVSQRAEVSYTPTGTSEESFMTPNFQISGKFVRISLASNGQEEEKVSATIEYYMVGEVE